MMKRKKVRRRAYPMPPVGQIALSPDQACAVTGIGRTKLDEVLKSGKLPYRKLGAKKIVIMRSDAEAFVRGLPMANAEART
jgi:excisionase family DNA binding protein